MAMTTGGGGGGPVSDINVTPLVDVMLVLLIIFMVSAPLMTTGVDVDLPSARAPVMEVDEQKLLLTVTSDGTIYLDRDIVPLDRLARAVQQVMRERRQNEIYVQGDETARYGQLVRVFAVLREAGIDKVGLVTDPLAQQPAPAPAGNAPAPAP
ncbi:MAG: biopolymer transporter ExbD [Deltaproteobacteria bacterium]|nr:biopolymer transporter ExbD [Deltaproteobacteria bacterium]